MRRRGGSRIVECVDFSFAAKRGTGRFRAVRAAVRALSLRNVLLGYSFGLQALRGL